jgi:GTP-binding protein
MTYLTSILFKNVRHTTLRNKSHGNFIDVKRVKIYGGKGGNGAVHFAREPFKPVAPADGGNGGDGSDIWIEITKPGNDLRHIKSRYTGLPGGNGIEVRGRGANGTSITISIPKGTVVEEITGDTEISHERLYIDSSDRNVSVGAKFLICKGGKGGKGNHHFISSTNRSPIEKEDGKDGQFRIIRMELKTIADIGLVGLPNAGKSSLVRAVSRCNTEVGNWAFTTIHPHIANIKFPAYDQLVTGRNSNIKQRNMEIFNSERATYSKPPFSMTIADIPGLIQGAAEKNRGLGHAFLRHIEKARIIAFVLDLSRVNPASDLKLLVKELEEYKKGLALSKTCIILGNKADIKTSSYEKIQQLIDTAEAEFSSWKVIPVSAKYSKNIGKVLWSMREIIETSEIGMERVINADKC